MRIMKRWLAFMIIISLAISDCGSIAAFATEGDTAVETSDLREDESISKDETDKGENSGGTSEDTVEDGNHEETDSEEDEDTVSYTDPVQDENAAFETDIAQTEDAVSVTDAEAELPFLHIGQINAWDELPSPDDSEFVYDLPVSFEMSDSVLLFVYHNMDAIPEKEESILVWSILRGENGMEEGSACLFNEDDDWADYEVVTDSPYFTMTENTDEESDYYQTVELTAIDAAAGEEFEDYENDRDYNYYIRAAYYFKAGEEQNEEFYAAVTLPFLPKEDTDIDDTTNIEETLDDTLNEDISGTEEIPAEEIPIDEIQENEFITEETEEAEKLDEEMLEEFYESTTLEVLDVLSAATEIFESDDQQDFDAPTEKLVLYLDDEMKFDVRMEPGDTRQVTAKIAPIDTQEEDANDNWDDWDDWYDWDESEYTAEDWQKETVIDPSAITWKSSDNNVVTVDNGLITAKAEGYAQITADYNGLTAAVKVEAASNGGTEKLLDLSGDIWVAGFQQEREDFVYTGQKFTQDIRVYHGDTLLTEKTDYTLTYKNNVNAAACNSVNAPSVTIKLKGQYSGSRTLYFTIKPRELDAGMSYEQVVSYANTLKISAPTLYYNNKKLTSGKDFTCDYSALPEEYKKGASYTPGTVYRYKINGIGNFTGEIDMGLVVLDDKNYNMSSATVTLDSKQYQYHGTPLSTADVRITSVKFGKNAPLDASLYQYEVYADGVGTGYIEVSPSAAGRDQGYRGMKRININIVGDRQISAAKTAGDWQETIAFSQKKLNDDGGMIQAKEGVLVYAGADVSESVPLTEGVDYTVKYSNHKKVGTATATFSGMGRYTGTCKITYKIIPNTDESNFTIVWKNVKKVITAQGETLETAYRKGGAVPDFILMDQDENILKNKTDYTVKLSNNKNVGQPMTCVITGKGNYNGYSVTKEVKVTTADIGQGILSVPDKQVSAKADAWRSTPTIKDVNGKKLAAGTDYDTVFDYSYDNMVSGASPEAGTIVTITVHGINNYAGSTITGTYRIYQTSIGKLKITIDAQEYTGKEITLDRYDIHAYLTSSDQKKKRNELWSDCFEIVGDYKNNIKAGTAKVTLRGAGEYGGTKTYSFKINKKAYLTNPVKKITLDKTSLAMSLQGDNTERAKLTATITATDDKNPLTNSTVIWSTSNSNVATVEGGEMVVKKPEYYGGSYEWTVTAQITLIKEGSVTITATAQDGNKKAKCTVTVADVPVIKDVDQPIKMKKGDTYQLIFENYEDSRPNLSGATLTSSNSDVVSIDKENFTLKANKMGYSIIKLKKGSYVQQFYAFVEEDNVPTKEDGYYIFEQNPSSADDTNDITNAIYRAYNTKYITEDGEEKEYIGIYIPAGIYWIDAIKNYKYGVFLDGRKNTWGGSDMSYRGTAFEIRFSPAALIRTIGNSESVECHVISMEQCQNITITGGTLIGERNEHKGTGGEAGHGIGIYDSSNITISGMDISQCWGDGIYLGRFAKSTVDNKKITIENCNVHDNRRSNLSITSGDDVKINDCQFNNAKGTDPQYGIDIETNEPNKPCKNITITNTMIKGNAGGSVGIITPAENITLKDCTLSGNFYNNAGKNVVLRNVNFLSGTIINGNGYTTTIN